MTKEEMKKKLTDKSYQISTLENRVLDLREKNEQIEIENLNLKEENNRLFKDIDSLLKDNLSLTDNVENLKKEIKKYKDIIIYIIEHMYPSLR